MWQIHAKLLVENRSTEPAVNKKVTKASNFKIGQLILLKNHQRGPFDLTYIYDQWVVGIPNKSTVLLTTPDGKEKKCNIHHIKPVSPLDMTTRSNVECPIGAFLQSQDSIQQDTSNGKFPSTHTTCNQKQRNHKYTLKKVSKVTNFNQKSKLRCQQECKSLTLIGVRTSLVSNHTLIIMNDLVFQ